MQRKLLCRVLLPAARWCSSYMRVEKSGPVAEVVLCRPKQLNVMGDAFFSELQDTFDSINDDVDVRVAILRAEGKHFSAGLDLKEAANMFFKDVGLVRKYIMLARWWATGAAPTPTPGMPAMANQHLLQMITRWQRSITAVETCRVPVIAAIHGKCVGGAVDLVCAADIRMCTEDAAFSVKETMVGIVADLGTLQRLKHITGRGIARELAFTGKDLPADRALQVGLVNTVVPSVSEVEAAARKMAAEIAGNSPIAVQGTKQIMNYTDDHTTSDGLKHVALWNTSFIKSNDLLEAVTAFSRKSAPKFTDHVVPSNKASTPE